MTSIKNSPSQEDLNSIFKRLLEAEIAEESDLPCKAMTMQASALLSLNSYCTAVLDKEQEDVLNQQKNYV